MPRHVVVNRAGSRAGRGSKMASSLNSPEAYPNRRVRPSAAPDPWMRRRSGRRRSPGLSTGHPGRRMCIFLAPSELPAIRLTTISATASPRVCRSHCPGSHCARVPRAHGPSRSAGGETPAVHGSRFRPASYTGAQKRARHAQVAAPGNSSILCIHRKTTMTRVVITRLNQH